MTLVRSGRGVHAENVDAYGNASAWSSASKWVIDKPRRGVEPACPSRSNGSPALALRVDDLPRCSGPPGAERRLGGLRARHLHGLIGPDGRGKAPCCACWRGFSSPPPGESEFRRGPTRAPGGRAPAPRPCRRPKASTRTLSVGEHLDFFRDLHAVPEDVYLGRRDRLLLRLTRLAPFVDRAAGHLSGGMYKKLGLMCALIAARRSASG